jgi:hypothetical protein
MIEEIELLYEKKLSLENEKYFILEKEYEKAKSSNLS